MTDQNVTKIDVQAQVKPIPDDDDASPLASPLAETLPAGDGTPHLPDTTDTLTMSDVMPITNPFEDVAEPGPLEADLRDLAVRNPGVQLTEIHHVHLGTPTPMPSTVQLGSQEQEDQLAHTGTACESRTQSR